MGADAAAAAPPDVVAEAIPQKPPVIAEIEGLLWQRLTWTWAKAHDETLWRRVRDDLVAALRVLQQENKIAPDAANDAFVVRCDRTTMSENDLHHGWLVAHVDVRLPAAAEFTRLTIRRRVHRRLPVSGAYLATLTYAAILAGLLAARALVDSLSFVSTGWLLVFALVPLLPVLVPELTTLARALSPYVSTLKVGQLEVGLRTAEPVVGSTDEVAPMLTDQLEPHGAAAPAPFSSTHARMIIDAVARIHEGGNEVVTVDLAEGAKWRLPNLYFLARLLDAGRRVRWMAFTEKRGQVDGYFVGGCHPGVLWSKIEERLPSYQAGRNLLVPAGEGDRQRDQVVADSFEQFKNGLTLPGQPPADAWVTTAELSRILGTSFETRALEWQETLTANETRTIVLAPDSFVALTVDGRFKTAVERDRVALEVARKAVNRA